MIIGIAGKAGSGKNEIGKILEREFGYCQIALADPIKRYVKDIFDFDDEKLWGPSEKRAEGDGRYPISVEARDFVDRANRTVRGYAEKEMVAAFAKATGLDPNEHFLSARRPCQVLGTEGVRAVWDSAWVDKAIRVARTLMTTAGRDYSAKKGVHATPARGRPFPGVAITDVRFRNEVEGIHAAGGFVIRVSRFETPRKLAGAAAEHSSELELASMGPEHFDAWVENDGTLGELRDKVVGAVAAF